MPKGLNTLYQESRAFPLLYVEYHDGTAERSLIVDGVNAPRPQRIWRLARRLTDAQLTAMQDFWEDTTKGGLYRFYYYDPYDVVPGTPIGSNYDPGGGSTQGRVTVMFTSHTWQQQSTLARTNVGGLDLIEVL